MNPFDSPEKLLVSQQRSLIVFIRIRAGILVADDLAVIEICNHEIPENIESIAPDFPLLS